MSRVYRKDIWRSAKKGWKRFLSIALITALGVAMLCGLYAACLDMYYAADRFYDAQNLFDIRVLSTLGLTENDVETLAQVDGVESAEGAYWETVHTDVEGTRKSADMTLISQTGLNRPYLMSGTLPEKRGEIAVTQKYMDASGKSLGDTLVIEEEIQQEEQSDEAASKKDSDIEAELGFDMDIPLEDDAETPTFARTSYTITGVVMDPMDIQSDGGGSIYRTTITSDYVFFITAADADNDIFTTVYITLSGTKELDFYSEEYEDTVKTAIRNIESRVKEQREQARYDAVMIEARKQIEDAENTMKEKFAEADEKFLDAWQEITEGEQELKDGEAALLNEQQEAERQIADARARLDSGRKELKKGEEGLLKGETELAEGEAELDQQAQELQNGKQKLGKERRQAKEQFDAAEQQLSEAQNELDTAGAQLEAEIHQLKYALGDMWPEQEWNALVSRAAVLFGSGVDDDAVAAGTADESIALAAALQGQAEPAIVVQAALGMGKIHAHQQALNAQKSALAKQQQTAFLQLDAAQAELTEGEAQINAARQTILSSKAELKAAKTELSTAKAELDKAEATLNAEERDAKRKIADAWQEIHDGKKELVRGKAELIKKEQEYADRKTEAEQKLLDAYVKLADIDNAQWYVQNRTSLDSYSSLKNDLSSIEAVGKVFPIIFLPVAVLMSLTTMTRMVEEERGLIGTYKALGFTNTAICRKYLLFAFMACLLGGVIGDLVGFILFPKFLVVILEELYSLPQYYLRFDMLYGVGGIIMFMIGIVGATVLACRSELAQMPAVLMRPKAPRAGSRVFLERVSVIWNRLKFLNKVTVRNLFRYKKRLFMTVGGIMGCTALILCGFAIKDSIMDLAPKQYEKIYQYDLMLVFDAEDHEAFTHRLSADDDISDYLNLQIDSVKLLNAAGDAEPAQLMVVPNGAAIEDYIRTYDAGGTLVSLKSNGIFITQNAAQILGLEPGDRVFVQNAKLIQREAVITDVVQNYLGNHVYMTQELYETLFEEYSPNGVLAYLSDTVTDPAAYAENLLDSGDVISSVSTFAMREDFGFDLINAVVLLLIVMAGGLAFVVLFTLSNTNISERARELATIKVLGFYDKEVHQYVNKETLMLTAMGILLGLPLGRLLSGLLTSVLRLPSIYFAVYIEPVSYLISAGITLCFAFIVNLITNRTLDDINMVEALKSVE
ncbi:MAG: FtsX-like permease family protein [Christensenellales bacterium]|jgi:putative ABC transport system permease protein